MAREITMNHHGNGYYSLHHKAHADRFGTITVDGDGSAHLTAHRRVYDFSQPHVPLSSRLVYDGFFPTLSAAKKHARSIAHLCSHEG